MGFALPVPAMSGADPWIGSNIESESPMSAPAATPSPPARPARRSLTISPNMFGATMTP